MAADGDKVYLYFGLRRGGRILVRHGYFRSG